MNSLLPRIAAGLLLAWAMAALTLGAVWAVRPEVFAWPLQAKLVVLGGGLVSLVGLVALLSRRVDISLAPVLEPLNRLAETDFETLAEGPGESALPLPESDPAATATLTRLRERMYELARITLETQQLHDGVEVRSRRYAEERDQLREILGQLADPVLAVDPFGDVMVANAAAERLLRFSAANPEQRALDKLVARRDLREPIHEARRRRGGSQRSTEIELEDETGRKHWYRLACRSLADAPESDEPSRALHGVVAVLTDISGQKAIQKRNAEFVSAVSHEMKTPLASIRAYVELLADGEAEDEASREEFLGIIQSQADRLQRLIDNLLNLARIEAGVVQVNKEPRSLNELLAEAVSLLQPTAEAKQIALSAELSPLYLGVLADRDTLLQGAINLISNAVKYTPNGGSVVVRSRLDGQEVVFEVQDTGVGLSETDRQKVFEKFYRVKKDQQMAAGTGLGLPLVKHIVEDVHAGRVELDSELGKGSTFRVLLPALHQLSA